MNLFTPKSHEIEPYPLPEEFYQRFEELSRAEAAILEQKMKIEAQNAPAESEARDSNVTSLDDYKRQKELVEQQALIEQQLSQLRNAVSTAIENAPGENIDQAVDKAPGDGYAEKAA